MLRSYSPDFSVTDERNTKKNMADQYIWYILETVELAPDNISNGRSFKHDKSEK